MKTAEEFFWKYLPNHNLTSQNVIDRERFNFDDMIELMERYAQQVSREVLPDFPKYVLKRMLDGGRKGSVDKMSEIVEDYLTTKTNSNHG